MRLATALLKLYTVTIIIFIYLYAGGSIVFNITANDAKNNLPDTFGEDAVRAKLQSFIESGILTKWSKTTHIYFEASGEEANAYILTVA